MATYQKRGYKPKTKEEEVQLDEQNSTTAEVFSSLDEGASKTEEWVSQNQTYILGVIGVIAVAVLGFLAYTQFVTNPKEENAAKEMFYPQQYFDQALAGTVERDSLLNLALNGAEGKYGFLDIIEEYSGTNTANRATYAAGMSYLQMQKYQEAISLLENYSADDTYSQALAYGAIGDAFMQLNQTDDALAYYKKAVNTNANGFTTPRFLYKAGIVALELDDANEALSYFERIKEEYATSDEAKNIDAFIGMAQN